MCVRYFGLFILLFSGGFTALSALRRCSAPKLESGYFATERDFYPPETALNYGCDEGYKPAVEGWWATITCVDGGWSPEPRCIDAKACLPPSIPNSKFALEPSVFYREGKVLRVECEDGYKHRRNDATAVCVNGTWTSVPVCEREGIFCLEPPRIPHAVIIQAHRDVFAADSELQYECEGGYSLEGGNIRDKITCVRGNWTDASPCRLRNSPGTGSDGSAGGGAGAGAGGGATTSAGDRTPPLSGGSRPGSGQDGSTAGGGHGGTSGGGGGSGTRPSTGVGGGGAGGTGGHVGSGTSTGGSSDSSDSSESTIHITTTDRCGRYPRVRNGEIVANTGRYLKFQCASFYKQLGPDKVVCWSNGHWSRQPICKDVYCTVDTSEHPQLEPIGVKILSDGETERFKCVHRRRWSFNHYSEGRCRDGDLTLSRCCNRLEFMWGC